MSAATDDIGGGLQASPDSVLTVRTMYGFLKSLGNPRGLTRTLGDFTLCGSHTGNSAAVFEVRTGDGRHLMLKCYMRPKEHLREIYGNRLLERELYLFTDGGGEWVDVVADEWVEGTTLSRVIADAAAAGDSGRLGLLAGRFDGLARGMLARDWAHGDLKPDNIIVTADMQLRLIDFDAVYMPSLRRFGSRELGTAAWQHPSRTRADYDRHLDDYPVAMISTVLHALAAEPSLMERYAGADELLLDPAAIAGGRCAALDDIERMFAKRCMAVRYRIARLLRSRAYVLPQLAEYMSYDDAGSVPCGDGVPELDVRNGLWGYSCGGRLVVPPLFDSATEFRDGCAVATLGGEEHRLTTAAGEVKIGPQGVDN